MYGTLANHPRLFCCTRTLPQHVLLFCNYEPGEIDSVAKPKLLTVDFNLRISYGCCILHNNSRFHSSLIRIVLNPNGERYYTT